MIDGYLVVRPSLFFGREQFSGLNLLNGRVEYPAELLVRTVNIPVGGKRLAGILTRDGAPARVPYRVYRRSDGALIKTGISAADGTYSVTGIPEVLCYLIALDPQDEFNAGVLDRLQPEA